MNTAIAPPRLETLDTKPSWHNRAGRVDRSACFVITAGQLWRRLTDDDWTYRLGLSPEARGLCTNSPQATRPKPHHFGKCDRYADLDLCARDLWLMHKWEQPYPLQGDFRSIKTNAMRAHSPHRKSAQRIQAQRSDPVLGDGPVNPNRGVGFNHHKMLGLDCLWQTTLRIERYIQHANLKQHFLVCPVCAEAVVQRHDGRAVLDGSPADYPSRRCSTASNRLPPGRVTKLYLPLCTPAEWNDADTAELWLATFCHPNRPWPPAAVQLIERYGELFKGPNGRQLRCRQCLGLRYGEVKRRSPVQADTEPGSP